MDEPQNTPEHDDNNENINEENNQENQQNLSNDQNEINAHISPVAAGFIGLIGGFFLYQFVGGLLSYIVFGFDFESAPINGVRLMTMAGQILFMLLPALVLSKVFYTNVSDIIRIKFPHWKEIALFITGIILLTPLLQEYLYIQNFFIEKLAANFSAVQSLKESFDSINELVEKTYANLLAADSVFEGALIVTVIAIVPAVCEETLFRGYIQRSFELKWKPYLAAFVTAFFFGLFHMNPYGLIPLIALGFYFGYSAYMSGSLIIPVILHFLNNFTAVIFYFIYGDDELISSTITSNIDLGSSLISFSLLLLIFIGLIILIRNYYSREKK